NGAKKGICKMLDFESAVIRAPQFVPAEAYSATFFNLNIKKLYDELYNILSKFDPMTAAQLNQPLFAGPDGQGGLQLKADIIDHLGSNIVMATKMSKPLTDDGEATPVSITALAISNRSGLERSLSLLHEKFTGANPDAKRELLGHTIYVVDLSMFLPFLGGGMSMRPMQLPGETGAPPMPKLAFTVTDTHLILGTESTVEQVIRRLDSSAESVASAKWFTTAKLAIPSVVGLAWLQDNAASGEFFWRMLKKSAGAGQERKALMGIALGPNPGLLFSQMG
ncbi:unnamed protein product, partial [marine sediment metagenome]